MNHRVRRVADGQIAPDEMVAFVVPHSGDPLPDDPVVSLRDLYGERLLHRPQDLYVAPDTQGRQLQDQIRAALRSERFDEDDSDEWAFRNWRARIMFPRDLDEASLDQWICDRVVNAALSYRDTGIPNDEAFGWVIRYVSATHAVHIRQHGWNPEAYSALLRACNQQAPAIENADAWIEAPIAWWRVLRYVEAGLRVSEALGQENRRVEGVGVDAAIDMLIGLRQ